MSLLGVNTKRFPKNLENIKSIKLFECSFPRNINVLNNLNYLEINYSNEINNNIWNLNSLDSLIIKNTDLYNNYIELKNLIELEKLCISYCNLNSFPEEVFFLNNLKDLDLSYNYFGYIPSEIGNLTNLIDLNLCESNLETIPSEIGKLTNLTNLNLSANIINILPEEFKDLIKLKTLNLSYNQLSEIPVYFSEFKNLETLNLANNQIKELPLEIGNLENLKVLDLSGNDSLNFKSVFEAFKNYKKEICISCHSFYYKENTLLIIIPNNVKVTKDINNLSNLRIINVSENINVDLQNIFNHLKYNKKNIFITNTYNDYEKTIAKNDTNNLYIIIPKDVTFPKEIGDLKKLQLLDLTGSISDIKEIKKLQQKLTENCKFLFVSDLDYYNHNSNFYKIVEIYKNNIFENIEYSKNELEVFANSFYKVGTYKYENEEYETFKMKHYIYSYTRRNPDLDSAIFYFKKTVELNPDLYNVMLDISDCYFEKNNFDTALIYCQKVLEIDSISIDAAITYSKIADCYIFLQNFVESESIAKKALSINPDFQLPYISLIMSYLYQNKFEEAKEIYIKIKSVTLEDGKYLKNYLIYDFKKMQELGFVTPEINQKYEELKTF